MFKNAIQDSTALTIFAVCGMITSYFIISNNEPFANGILLYVATCLVAGLGIIVIVQHIYLIIKWLKEKLIG